MVCVLFENPTGELPMWFTLDTCLNHTAAIGVTGRDTFDVYHLRADATEGVACPVAAEVASASLDITFEANDENLRKDGSACTAS